MMLVRVVFFFVVVEWAIQEVSPKECEDKVEIRNCEDPPAWKRRKVRALYADLTTQCKHPKVSFEWTIKDVATGKYISDLKPTKSLLPIKPFSLPKGEYEIAVYLLDSKSRPEPFAAAFCQAVINSEDPIPVLAGGNERSVPSGKSYTMDGRKSRNMDSPGYSSRGLRFKWKCTVVEGGDDDSFCKTLISVKSTVVVPERYVKPAVTYEFTLYVKSSDSDWISTSQLVRVLNNDIISITIDCRKNCSPRVQFTNVNVVTYFEVICDGNCNKAGVQSYEWTLEGQQLNYNKDTEFGRNDAKFIMNGKVLQPGKKYKVRVVVKGSSGSTGEAVQEFETGKPPTIQSCNTNPPSGTVFETKFEVGCQFSGQISKFEIYTAKKDSDKRLLLTSAATLKKLKFMLPADNEVFIKIIDDQGLTAESKLDVKVTPRPDGGENKVDALKKTVDDLKETKNYEQAAQAITSLLFETKKQPDQNAAVGETKKWIIEKLDKFPLDSEDHVKQIASIMASMADGDEKNPNPDVAEKISEMCKKLAEKALQQTMESTDETKSSDTQQISKDLMSCIETNTQENAELLKPDDTVHVETPFPPLPEEVIPENYPDYVDDERATKNTDKLDVAAKNSMDICVLNAKSISATTVAGEGAVAASTKFCEVSVTKDTGSRLVETRLTAKGVSVTPSLDFQHNTDDITSTV